MTFKVANSNMSTSKKALVTAKQFQAAREVTAKSTNSC